MFNDLQIDPQVFEFVLGYVIPAVIMVVFAAVGAFGSRKAVENLILIWRAIRPLLDEKSDPAVIWLARALGVAPEEILRILQRINDEFESDDA
jgi:hypothetical protein